MRYGQMIAFEVIIDIYLPVTVDRVIAAARESKVADPTAVLRDLRRNRTQHLFERRRGGILIHQDVRPPLRHSKLRKADLRPIPVFHAFKLGLSDELPVEG